MRWRIMSVSYDNNREIPVKLDDLLDLLPFAQPENEWQALMEAPACHEPATPKSDTSELTDIVRDCMELLLEQDQYIIHAVAYERLTYEELGKRLGVSAPHAWRLKQIAYQHLGEILMVDGRIRKYLGEDE